MNLHEIELLVHRKQGNAADNSSESSQDDEFQVHPQHLVMPSIDDHRDEQYRQSIQ